MSRTAIIFLIGLTSLRYTAAAPLLATGLQVCHYHAQDEINVNTHIETPTSRFPWNAGSLCMFDCKTIIRSSSRTDHHANAFADCLAGHEPPIRKLSVSPCWELHCSSGSVLEGRQVGLVEQRLRRTLGHLTVVRDIIVAATEDI